MFRFDEPQLKVPMRDRSIDGYDITKISLAGLMKFSLSSLMKKRYLHTRRRILHNGTKWTKENKPTEKSWNT